MHALIACSSKKVCAYYEYTLISGNGSRSWQADEDAVSYVIISTREYGPVLHACRWRDSSTYTRGQIDAMAAPSIFCHSVCLANGEVHGSRLHMYVLRELSCKCSLSSVALRVLGASARSVVVSR